MVNIYISPGKYVQGNGVLKDVGDYAYTLGKNAFCIISPYNQNDAKPIIDRSFINSKTSVFYEIFNGECCMSQINRLMDRCRRKNIDVIIGVGSGKTLDIAKAIAYYLNFPVIIIPTTASTDAPCSAISVLYNDDGVFDRYLYLKNNPNLVLVDNEIIAKAPLRHLAAGMGDALSTFFESRAYKRGCTNTDKTVPLAAYALARQCYESLMASGRQAYKDVSSGTVSEAVRDIIEVNILLSGIGFESGGQAAAHSINNALTTLSATRGSMHGEKVAFGTIVQLVLEDDTDYLDKVIDFCTDINLPVTLSELGIEEIIEDDIMCVAKASLKDSEPMHNMPMKYDATQIYNAIIEANRLGQLKKDTLSNSNS